MEKCDGQRNLLHMCAEASIPSSNKEQKAEEKDEKARKQAKAALSAAASRKGNFDLRIKPFTKSKIFNRTRKEDDF